MNDLRFAERNHVIRSGVRRSPIAFAIEPLVLKKHHRIIATNGCSQETRSIERIRRKDYPHAGSVGKDALPTLRVINGAAGKISTDGYANDAWRREISIGAPAHNRKLVAQLHHCRPDVIEELDFSHGLQPAYCHADRAACDAGFGNWRIKNSVGSEIALQSRGQLKDTALSLDHLLPQILFTAAIGNIFTKNHDALITLHFVP